MWQKVLMAAKGFLYYTVSNHSHSEDKNCIKGIWYVCDSASMELLLISLLLKQFYNIGVAERTKPNIFTCWDTEMYLLGMLSMVEAAVANPAVPGEVCYRLRYNSGFLVVVMILLFQDSLLFRFFLYVVMWIWTLHTAVVDFCCP